MSGNYDNEITTNLQKIKESMNYLEFLYKDYRTHLIKSILRHQDKTGTD
jgi:hypothetical protein